MNNKAYCKQDEPRNHLMEFCQSCENAQVKCLLFVKTWTPPGKNKMITEKNSGRGSIRISEGGYEEEVWGGVEPLVFRNGMTSTVGESNCIFMCRTYTYIVLPTVATTWDSSATLDFYELVIYKGRSLIASTSETITVPKAWCASDGVLVIPVGLFDLKMMTISWRVENTELPPWFQRLLY